MNSIFRRAGSLRALVSKNANCVLCENGYRRLYSFKRNPDSRRVSVGYKGFLVFAGSAGLGFGLGCYYVKERNNRHYLPGVDAAKRIDDGPSLREKYNFIADVVEIAAPSVVYIEIKDQRRVDFFTGEPATVSNGSGFIVRENGLILTNAHVVINKPQSSVLVKLHNGKTYTGVVEDVDMKSDLATVRIQCSGLPVMKLGSSNQLRPGEWVVAIGSPLSLSNTITSGVVSTVNRASEELGLRGKDMDYIQTDASITFGNSGGPLVNLDGEAIGINSMKVTPGISFAIPIDYAKEFLKRSEAKKLLGTKIRDTSFRRYMGITMLTLTPEIIAELQLRDSLVPPDVSYGVIVWKVVVGSPAHKGGLRPGDIITHINGDPVQSAGTIYTFLESTGEMNVTIIRSGHRFNVVVLPEEV